MSNRNEQVDREQPQPGPANPPSPTSPLRPSPAKAGFSTRRVALVIGVVLLVVAGATIGVSLFGAKNNAAIQCLVQSMLDIIEGKTGAHYNPLSSACAALHLTSAGDGNGLLGKNGYIAQADAQLTLATAQPDATNDILVHRRHVGYALTDMTGWLTTLDHDTLALLNNPQATAAIPAIVTLANHDLYGVDLNHDGTIDYVPGEAGATIAYIHGQYMAGLLLAAPA